ncbi:MAG TPA: pitrilysin family protein, partial [Flavobacteriaceae bacterium]|nr:pitrilysin family protein [Flavobacteriaceae bacterium]
ISKDDFNEEIDFLGARMSFGSSSAYASGLSKYFPRIFELMADATKNPLFTEEEFQKEKDKLLEGIRADQKNVPSVARRVALALIYGKNHPKGEFITEETIQNITFADVKSYYETFFSPENAYLLVIGDVLTSQVTALSNLYFSDWKSKSVLKVDYSTPQDVQYTQINFVDMPNAVQSEITVQNIVNLKMDHPDFHAVLLANYVLGGGGTHTKLNGSLRETYGWTYGAYSSTGSGKHVNRFAASTSVRNAVTDSAVTEILRIIREMRDTKITTQELADAKAKYVGDFVRALERPETIANYALNIETQNLSEDFYENYLKKINAVTVDDIQRVAKKYFSADNSRVVVVGKGSEVLEGLKNIKRPDGKTIPVFYFDSYANAVDEPVYTVEMDPSMTKEKVLNSYFEAIGGKEAMNKVKTLAYTANAEFPGAPAPLSLSLKSDASGKKAVEMNMMGMSIMKQVTTQEKAYVVGQGQREDIEGDDLIVLAKNAYPFPELNLLNDEAAILKGIEVFDGANAYVIQNGNSKILFDTESGLKLAEVTEMPEGTSTMSYRNYTAVEGIKFPADIFITMGPQVIEFKDGSILVNEGVSEEDFN